MENDFWNPMHPAIHGLSEADDALRVDLERQQRHETWRRATLRPSTKMERDGRSIDAQCSVISMFYLDKILGFGYKSHGNLKLKLCLLPAPSGSHQSLSR